MDREGERRLVDVIAAVPHEHAVDLCFGREVRYLLSRLDGGSRKVAAVGPAKRVCRRLEDKLGNNDTRRPLLMAEGWEAWPKGGRC